MNSSCFLFSFKKKPEAQKVQFRREQEKVSMHQTDEIEPLSFKLLSLPPQEKQETEKPMDTNWLFLSTVMYQVSIKMLLRYKRDFSCNLQLNADESRGETSCE